MLREGGCKRLPLEVTGWWAGLPDERLKWRREVGEALARARLLSLPDLDAHLAKVRRLIRLNPSVLDRKVPGQGAGMHAASLGPFAASLDAVSGRFG